MSKMEAGGCDLLLRGGIVIDPASGLHAKRDVAVKNHTIAAIAESLPAECAVKVLDVQGSYVVPGLIDMHCHIVPPTYPLSEDKLPTIDGQAVMFQSGVTTAVDAGTCGWKNYARFQEDVVKRSSLRILSFVNIAADGMLDFPSEQRLEDFSPEAVAELAKAYPDAMVGVKTAHYWVGKPFDAAHPGWASVDACLKAGELSGKPVMADVQPTLPGRSYPDLIGKKLRPGDIHTHVYAQQFAVLNERGEVSDFMRQARARGVVFDLGHGAGSFWFRNAQPAYVQGFFPDTLSTDLYLDNISGPAINLLHIMSKYLAIGMPLDEVILRVTKRPAEVLGHPELGALRVDGEADIAVLRMAEGSFGFADCGRARITGTSRLECLLTMRSGKVVYNPEALGMPDWQDAPAPYWTAPGVLDH